MKTETLKSVAELIQRISSGDDPFFRAKHFFCFRGQKNAEWDLIPTMFRETVDVRHGKLAHVERDIYRDFQDRARPYAEGRFNLQDPWEMLCFAQHYGVPTRLLDWTSNPLVGLYFAIFSSNYGKHEETDAALWCMNVTLALDPKTSDSRSYMRGKRLADLPTDVPFFRGLFRRARRPNQTDIAENFDSTRGKVQIIQAPDINDRIRTQAGLFSVFIPDESEEDQYDHSHSFRSPNDQVLMKLVIPAQARLDMQRELEHLGMLPDQIYPDLEGIGIFLKYWRSRRLKESEYER